MCTKVFLPNCENCVLCIKDMIGMPIKHFTIAENDVIIISIKTDGFY